MQDTSIATSLGCDDSARWVKRYRMCLVTG